MSVDETPTGGKDSAVPPTAQSGGTPSSPDGGQAVAPQPTDASREAMIPRERFDQALAKTEELESKVTELEAKVQAKPKEGGAKTWADVPQTTLDTILADPIKYREHYAGAREEDRRRLIADAQRGATQAMTLDQLRAREVDAFNTSTPLGKEVHRILSQANEAEVVSMAIELARHRLTAKPTATNPNTALANNLATALSTPPGGTSTPNPSAPPNWVDMPKEDFEKARQRVILGVG